MGNYFLHRRYKSIILFQALRGVNNEDLASIGIHSPLDRDKIINYVKSHWYDTFSIFNSKAVSFHIKLKFNDFSSLIIAFIH